MPSVANTGAFSDLVAPGLRKVWFNWLKEHKPEYPVFLNVVTDTKRKYEEHIKVGELPMAETKPEGQPINYVTPDISELKRFTQVAYGLGFRITREMYDFDLYGPMKRMSAQLAESCRDRMEIIGASVLNNAFNTSYGGFVSTESLCSTSHALLSGGTAANRPSTDVDFTMSALQAACDVLEGNLNEQSQPRPLKPQIVIADYRLKWALREILGSPDKPYTSNNEINPLVDEDIKWFLSHRFTDTDQWFLTGSKESTGLWMFITKQPTFDNGDDFDTKDAKFSSYFRCVSGYDEWRGVYGSSGG